MVNFTCNSCGDSLKKKEVGAHFSRKQKCRQAPSLTCFDCLKSFGNDYQYHTSCVTEDQRYSANGLKGIEKSKSQIWFECVQKHLTPILEGNDSLSPASKNIIKYVLQNPSVPRKEKPFLNFVRNTRRYEDNDIKTVWNFLSEISKKQENQDPINGKPQDKNSHDKSHSNGNKNPQGSKSVSEEETINGAESKKKKKSKKTVELNEEMEDVNITGDLTTTNKTKKNKSIDILPTNGNSESTVMEVEEQNSEVQSEKLSKKEMKLKKKKEKYEAELKSVEIEQLQEQPDNIDDPIVEDKESKKKKKKKQNVQSDVNIEMDKQKKKKRERTVSMAAETDQPCKKNKSKGNDESTETGPNEEATEVASSNRKDFNWADVIIQVLQSQDDKEMSVKRLCKKVVNEYLSSLLEGAHVDELKATTKFQKKLNKTPGVFVHKDKAKLKSTE